MRTMNGKDLYLRHTNPDGTSHVVQHRVWDAELFLTACQAACNKMNADEPNPMRRNAAVTLATAEEYRTTRS